MKPYIPQHLPLTSINYAAPKLITAMGESNRALAHYNALLEHSPSKHLLLAPLTRNEATLSSRIEGSNSTLSEVLQFDEDKSFSSNEQRDDLNEIKNYVHALNEGQTELQNRTFSLNLLRNLHKILLGHGSVRGQTKNPGVFRISQNWIGQLGVDMEHATFVPPAPLFVTEFMENWIKFYRSDQPDFLVQAAILHAQFELIHPFDDGNGRLGRLLIPLFLSEKKVITQPSFYLSGYLEKNRDTYMDSLRQLNNEPGNWNGWLLFFLGAITTQALETSNTIKRITELYDDLKYNITNVTRSPFAVHILDAVFESPVFSSSTVKRKLAVLNTPPSGPTISALLKKLVEHDILTVRREGKGRRSTVYMLNSLIQLIENET